MKLLNYYEIIAVAVPGAAFIIGLAIVKPQLADIILSKDFGIANLSIFLVIAYVAGHLIHACGNVIEDIYWRFAGGMPTYWVLSSTKKALLDESQIKHLRDKIKSKLQLTGSILDKLKTEPLPESEKPQPLDDADKQRWFGITNEICDYVRKNGDMYKIERFNANYGLNRGIAAVAVVMGIMIVFLGRDYWIRDFLVFALIAFVSVYRMQRFGKAYAQELFGQFLVAVEKKETVNTNK